MHPRGSRGLAPMRLRGALAPLSQYRFSARDPHLVREGRACYGRQRKFGLCFGLCQTEEKVVLKRHVKLFKNRRNKAVRIPSTRFPILFKIRDALTLIAPHLSPLPAGERAEVRGTRVTQCSSASWPSDRGRAEALKAASRRFGRRLFHRPRRRNSASPFAGKGRTTPKPAHPRGRQPHLLRCRKG